MWESASETQSNVAAAISAVARTVPNTTERLHKLVSPSPKSEGVLDVQLSEGAVTYELAVTQDAHDGTGMQYSEATVTGCFRIAATWETVTLTAIECPRDARPPLINPVPAATFSVAPDVEVSHLPCYGGEPPDDPNCPGG